MRRQLRLRFLQLAGHLRPPAAAAAEPRRILLIRPDHLGDLVLSAGAVAALRQAFPAAELTAWVGPWGEPVWRHHPALDAIRMCPFPGFTRRAKANPLAPYVLALREARRLRFDLAINLRFDFWWGAMTACWAGIPVVGYDVAECRPFLTQPVPYTKGLHESEQSLRLVSAVAGRPMDVPTFDLFPQVEVDVPEGAIAIHPGAGAEVKLWREDSWAEVIRELAKEGPLVLTAGSSEEVRMAQRISAGHQIASGLSLPELASLYRRCRLVLGPDNGPLHVARSVGTPTITLFGPTDDRLFGPPPTDPDHVVLRLPWRCIPCGRLDYNPAELSYHLCVKLIEPVRVLEAARRVLMARASKPS